MTGKDEMMIICECSDACLFPPETDCAPLPGLKAGSGLQAGSYPDKNNRPGR